MAAVKLFLFGAPRLDRGGAVTEMDTRKALALLAYLALNSGSHSRDSLAALFYPENDQASGRGALRRTLSSLRKALGGIGLDAEREQISLTLGDFWVDVLDFRDRMAETRTHGHPTAQSCPKCIQPLEEAVRLYRDGFMVGFGLRDSPQFDDWQYFLAEELRQDYAGALQKLARLQAAEANYDAAIARTRQWLSLDQLQEAAHRDLMMYYAWSGQRNVALRQYRECVRILEQELSVPPLDETTELYQAILENNLPPPPGMEKSPGEVFPELSRSLPPETRYSGPFPLVGRENERRMLRQAYMATNAKGFLFILEGEAGIGKTRLAEELLTEVKQSGAAVASGRCYEGESGLGFTPFLDALNFALSQTGAVEKLRRLPAAVIAPAAQLVTSLYSLLPELPVGPASETPGARLRFFEALRTLLVGLLVGDKTGVVFLDDLHWADADSMDLLAYLSHRMDRLFYLCAWRGDLVPPDHRLRQLYSHSARGGNAGFMALPRLGQGAVAELVTLALDPAASTREIADQLYVETEGNPFFIVEYLNALRTAEISAGGEEWKMPTGVREVLRARLTKIGELGMQLLGAGAVIGHSFDFNLLRDASGRSEVETISGCEMLLQEGLIVEQPAIHSNEPHKPDQQTYNLEYNFTHDKLRTLVYELTSLARRRLLHQRVAEAYAGRARMQDQNNGLAAYHYRMAGQPGVAAEFFRKAGEHARQIYANRDAVGYFQNALACGHPEPSGIHEAIGDLEALSGNYQSALAAYETAAALSSPSDLPWIESKIGRVHDWRGEWELAECHYEAAAGEISEEVDPGKLAGLYADWSRAAYRRGELIRGQDLAQHSLDLSTKGKDLPAQAQALNILGLLARARRDYSQATQYLQDSLEVANRLGEHLSGVAAMNNLGRLHAEMGNLTEALHYTRTALDVCLRQGDRHHAAALHNNLADLYHASGQAELAMEQLKQAVVIFAEIGSQTAEPLPEIWKLTEW